MKGNPWVQKVIALIAAYIVAFAANHGLTLSPDETAGILITVYSAVEFFVSKKTNPGNASSSHLAEKESNEVHQLKMNDR